jgi:hypothetical protein
MKHHRHGCASALDQRVTALVQQHEPIRELEAEYQTLRRIPESARTAEQTDRYYELMADLILSHQWTGLALSDNEMNEVFLRHVAQPK